MDFTCDRSGAQSSLNLSKLASCRPRRRASEPRSGVARCSGSSAQGSLNSPNSYRSPVRKNAADIQKVQTHLNNHALPVPLPSQVFFEGQNGAKTAPRRPKTRQDVPRCAKMRPRGPQDGPRRAPQSPDIYDSCFIVHLCYCSLGYFFISLLWAVLYVVAR